MASRSPAEPRRWLSVALALAACRGDVPATDAPSADTTPATAPTADTATPTTTEPPTTETTEPCEDVVTFDTGLQAPTGRWQGVYDLPAADVQVMGTAPESFTGSVLGGADLNGDGYSDLLLGSEDPSVNDDNHHVFFGPLGPGALTTDDADVLLHTRDISGDFLSWNPVLLGDVDGDGAEEIAIHSLDDAYVVHGALLRGGPQPLQEASLFSFELDQGFNALLVAPVHAGGGPLPDLLIGESKYGHDRPTGKGTGAVHTLLDPGSAPVGTVYAVDDSVATIIGRPLSTLANDLDAGDFDGDGVDDLALGAYTAHDDDGAVFLVHDPPQSGTHDIDTVADAEVIGVDPGSGLGWQVVAAGDLNDDGYGDVVVGTMDNGVGNDTDETGLAAVLLGPVTCTGPVDELAATLYRGAPWENLALNGIEVLSNFDGSGMPALAMTSGLVGDGGVRLFYAPLRSGSFLADSEADARLVDTGDGGCCNFAAIGDINGDGFDDIGLAAPWFGAGFPDGPGSGFLFFGGP